MQLTVKDVAGLFNVNEKTIYRWLKKGSLPAYCVGNQYRFNRAELLEWATARQIGVSADIFSDNQNDQEVACTLAGALKNGGIYYRVEGPDKDSAINSVVQLTKLPADVDRPFLSQMLLAREAMVSTAIGGGIAIPHVRNPIVLHITEPVISLCFLENPIDFGALDGRPVYCLFTMITPAVKTHLHLLSRLSYALQDSIFRDVLQKQGTRDEILSNIARIEAGLKQNIVTDS